MNKHQQQFSDLFNFLKEMKVKGLAEFASYEEYHKAKPNLVPLYKEAPRKFTQIEGQAGFAIQHAKAEQEARFSALSDEEKMEYEAAFGVQ